MTLTLTRKRSFIECAAKIYLYVQCSEKDAIVDIMGTPCNLFGRLKNGKTVSLSLADEETMIFVTSSSMTAHFTIPAGTKEISLLASPTVQQGNSFIIKQV